MEDTNEVQKINPFDYFILTTLQEIDEDSIRELSGR